MRRRFWKSILVAILDPLRARQLALSKAAAIAARCGARVTLLDTFMLPLPPQPRPVPVSSQDVVRATIAKRMEQLERLADPLRDAGIKVDCVVEWDFPTHEAIVRQVLKRKPDLLVADSARHGRLARKFLANTDWELIRACPCPLWFVRSDALPRVPDVLVAVDPRHTHAKPSKLDHRLLEVARHCVRQLGGEVNVGHFYPPAVAPGTIVEPLHLPIRLEPDRRFEQQTRILVDKLAAKYSIAPARRFVRPGDATRFLPKLVEELGAHILVMGAVSRGLQQPFIGNTAETVIDRVDCDVLVVKPVDFKSNVKPGKAKLRPL